MKNIEKTISKTLLCAFALLLPLADLIFLHIYAKPFLQALSALFIVLALYNSYQTLLVGLFFLIIEQTIFYGSIISPLIFYSFMGFFFYSLRTWMNTTLTILPFICLGFLLLFKNLLFDPLLLKSSVGYYTLQEISVTMVVLYGILKLTTRGTLGNRL